MAHDRTAFVAHEKPLSPSDHASIVSDVLFSSIGEGAVVIDERGHISRVNKIALDILGCKEKDLLGRWYPEAIIAEEANGRIIPNIERPVTEVFLSGKPVFKRIFYQRKNGTKVAVALTVSPLMYNDKPLGAIQLFRDITDELRLEHAKDEFISIASHQLRTPATVVKQYLGMVLEGYAPTDEKRTEMLRIAYDHNNNQLEIINDLLKVAQIESKVLEAMHKETDVVALIKKIVISQQPDYDNRHIKLELSCEHDEAVAEIDPLHLQMILENLINNANKYSSEDSTVSIKVEDSPAQVTVHIQDQGIGIDTKDIPKLFNKFSRIASPESTVSGNGLGLYWAKKLIELYGGEIKVTSKLHKGTTFSVGIPRERRV
ncbi:MAG TPA: PAS domain-containing sensor histidine kinase [Candidatus Nitrosotenuis sp.]|nr:PAS domain-containing sensor histidine kinase [Candidatus Nitrosotenuis sp.]